MADSDQYAWEDVPAGVACWHIHHNRLCEYSTEPLATRAEYIREHKWNEEVLLRLRLMRPVRGELPAAVVETRAAYEKARVAHEKTRAACEKAEAAYEKARAARGKAWAAYNKTWAACEKAWAARRSEIEALHRAECPDCTWNGESIFPEGSDDA